MLQQPELLAPAGSLETLKYAVMYGADAVYCALPEFGMRAAPVNLTVGELHEGCIFAHARGKKVYLTLNTLPTNEELSKLPRYIQDAAEAGVDAFIIADLGVLALAKKYAPQVERHVSTQAGITNYEAAKVCYELGAKRVVLARELPLTEIAQIRDNCPQDLELEAFVHGAMCMSVSGRCLLSNYMTGRDSNRGACAQPCRYQYALVEEKRPGEYFPVFEDEKGRPEPRREFIHQVRLKQNGRLIPFQEFFSSEYYYGDYTRSNHWLVERYHIRAPKYRPLENVNMDEVDASKLYEVLEELQCICHKGRAGDEKKLKVFDLTELEAFVQGTASAFCQHMRNRGIYGFI